MFVENGLLEIKSNSISLLGNSYGNTSWNVNGIFIGVVNDKVVARNVSGLQSNILAFSMKDGSKVWKSSMGIGSGVFQNIPVDDNHEIVVASNLCLIDWRTGELIKLKIVYGLWVSL